MPATDLGAPQLTNRAAGLAVPPGAWPQGELAADVANGNSFANDGRTILWVRNSDGAAPHTVTVAFARTVDGVVPAARSYTLPLSTAKAFGPFSPDDYGSTVTLTADNVLVRYVLLRLP